MTTDSTLEVTLAAFRQVLGQPGITADDDFFELGGDSMQALDVLAMVEEAMGTEIPAALFFTYPTATELTGAIVAAAGVPS